MGRRRLVGVLSVTAIACAAGCAIEAPDSSVRTAQLRQQAIALGCSGNDLSVDGIGPEDTGECSGADTTEGTFGACNPNDFFDMSSGKDDQFEFEKPSADAIAKGFEGTSRFADALLANCVSADVLAETREPAVYAQKDASHYWKVITLVFRDEGAREACATWVRDFAAQHDQPGDAYAEVTPSVWMGDATVSGCETELAVVYDPLCPGGGDCSRL